MKRVIVVIVLLLAVGVGVTLWIRGRLRQGSGAADLQTVRVQRGTVRLTITADGVLKPLTTVMIKSYASGEIQTLAVEVGDEVKAGDLIATIDPTDSQTAYEQALADLHAAQARLTQARAQAKVQPTLTQASINQAEASYNAALKDLERLQQATHPQTYTQVRSALDKAQASLDVAQKDVERLQKATHPQAQAQARSALDKAQANLDIAETELTRAEGLKAHGYVSQSEVDTARNRRDLAKAELASAQERWDTLEAEQAAELRSAQARVDQAQADMVSAQKRWDTLEVEQSTELQSAEARVAQAQAGLDQARANAVQAQLRKADVTSAQAQVARAQAQVDNAQIMLDYTTVRAPRDGVILQKIAEQGTIVTSGRSVVGQGTDIVELGDLTKMFVEVQLDEVDVGKVQAGQPVSISIDAFPDEQFQGVVTRIDPQAVSQQNITTVLTTVQVNNPDKRLKPEMTATCEFLVDQIESALYLPSRAVEKMDGKYAVMVATGQELATAPVRVGLVGDENTEIVAGLKEGDEVIMPQLGGGPGGMASRFREMGRRMGGAGGFVR